MHAPARLIRNAGIAAIGIIAGVAYARARKTALKASMVLHGDWEGQLTAEHAAVKRLLKAMTGSEVGEAVKRVALLDNVASALTRHAVEEENVIYPALREAGADVDILYAEHTRMKTLIAQLKDLSPDDPEWSAKAKALKTLVYAHVRKEETQFFPLLHDSAEAPETDKLTKLVRRQGAKVG